MTTPNAVRPRDMSLDVARGIAIVAVVLGHTLGGLIDSGLPESVPSWTSGLIRALYLSHLPVFAFVTGLLMPRGIERMGRGPYLTRRLTLLAYLYLLWTLIEGTAEVLASRLQNDPTSWHDVLSIWSPLAHLWFLPTLAVGTCAVVALRPWRRTWAASLTTADVVVGSIAAWGWSVPVIGGQGLALVAWFVLGAFVTHQSYLSVLPRVPNLPLFGVAVLGLAALWALAHAPLVTTPTVDDPSRSLLSVALGLVGSTAGVAAVMAGSALISRVGFGRRPFAYLGRMSLQIYLAHIIFAAGARVLLGLAGVTGFWVLVTIATAAGVLGPLALASATRGFRWLFQPPWYPVN